MITKKEIFICILFVTILILPLVIGFASGNFKIPEEPDIQSKDIYVVVTDIEKKEYYAGTAIREVTIEVYSKEYNLRESYTETYKGIFGNIPCWSYKKGDIVKARLCTAVIQSTGKVVDRYIDKVY